MPDIIVTTPKSRMAEAAREAEEVKAAAGGWYYRDYRAPRIPKVDVGDRVYYIEDGYIRGFAVVARVERIRDRDTGKVLAARVMMDARSWSWIKPIPVAPWEVVRSYMYAGNFKLYSRGVGLARDRVNEIGGWLDPKPRTS
jgi:hypothetical protein